MRVAPIPMPRKNHPQHNEKGAKPGVGNMCGLTPTQVLPACIMLGQQPVRSEATRAAAVYDVAAIHCAVCCPRPIIFTQSIIPKCPSINTNKPRKIIKSQQEKWYINVAAKRRATPTPSACVRKPTMWGSVPTVE